MSVSKNQQKLIRSYLEKCRYVHKLSRVQAEGHLEMFCQKNKISLTQHQVRRCVELAYSFNESRTVVIKND